MKLEHVEAIAIDIPLRKNFGGSTYSVLKRSTVVTRLTTADGLTSSVYNGDNRAHGPEIVRIITEELFPLIKGSSIFASERMWEKMFALAIANRNRKTLLEAIACVDCAVWDLIGSRGDVRELGRRDGAPRRIADLAAAPVGRAARHVRRVLCRSRARSRVADDVDESAHAAERLDRSLARAGIRLSSSSRTCSSATG
jgi:hypothetical protein